MSELKGKNPEISEISGIEPAKPDNASAAPADRSAKRVIYTTWGEHPKSKFIDYSKVEQIVDKTGFTDFRGIFESLNVALGDDADVEVQEWADVDDLRAAGEMPAGRASLKTQDEADFSRPDESEPSDASEQSEVAEESSHDEVRA
jgi:hypothetical protein